MHNRAKFKNYFSECKLPKTKGAMSWYLHFLHVLKSYARFPQDYQDIELLCKINCVQRCYVPDMAPLRTIKSSSKGAKYVQVIRGMALFGKINPVSYTHLTLPTIYSV